MDGRIGTGKTSIINAFFGKDINPTEMTISTTAFMDQTINVKGKDYHLEIWDIAGQEKYPALTKIFVKDAKIINIVYSIDKKISFDSKSSSKYSPSCLIESSKYLQRF